MPSGCNCANSVCSCVVIGTGAAHVGGVGSETSPYEVTVDPTQTDYLDSSTVKWTIGGQGTEASPYTVLADASGSLPPAVLTPWGTAPLDDFGAAANSPLGQAAYTDSAGKLRTQPLVINTDVLIAAADPISRYPIGPSVYGLSSTQAAAGGWPVAQAGILVTNVGPVASTASQWYYRNGSTQATQDVRFRIWAGSSWGPWQRPVFTPDAPAEGLRPVYRAASSAFKLESALAANNDTGWIDTGVSSDLIVPNATNATLTGAFYRIWGPILAFRISFTLKVAITNPTDGNIANVACGTFNSQFRPLQEASCTSYSTSRGLFWAIGTSGNLTLSAISGSTNMAIGDVVAAAGMFFVG